MLVSESVSKFVFYRHHFALWVCVALEQDM